MSNNSIRLMNREASLDGTREYGCSHALDNKDVLWKSMQSKEGVYGAKDGPNVATTHT